MSLEEQYRTDANLNARIALHARFSTNPGWSQWLFDHEAPPSGARLLEVGCGPATTLWGANLERIDPSWKLTLADFSPGMIEAARDLLGDRADYVVADAQDLPFDDGGFQRVFTGHFYGHLEPWERELFLAEARRVAPELVVVDAIARKDRAREEWQERILEDGSRWQVFKRYFDPEQLAAELGGGEVLHSSRWFVLVRA